VGAKRGGVLMRAEGGRVSIKEDNDEDVSKVLESIKSGDEEGSYKMIKKE
jgi:hypothetical protein